jgi:aspartate/methionine/tyrosine aminotransferase
MRSFMINPCVTNTQSPPILEARSWLSLYNGSMGAPIDLSQAAPPYAPSVELLERISTAATSPEFARYGPVPGEDTLREAYARHVSSIYGSKIGSASVSITAGANQAFVIAAMVVAQRGDTILLPAPWYFNHKMTLDMLGIEARAVGCRAEDGFIPDIPSLLTAIDASVRAIVLVTPNNPTGAIYPPSLIETCAEIGRERGIWLIIDETYRDFAASGGAHCRSAYQPAFSNGSIGLYSFSKSLAIPGHRLGAMVHPAGIAEQVTKLQDCLQICPPRAGQEGVAWALEGLEDWRTSKRHEFVRRANYFSAAMKDVPKWKIESIGAYFAYVRHPHQGESAFSVGKRLAVENGLLTIPGSYFGPQQEDYLRVSFGCLKSDAFAELPRRFAMADRR